MLESSADRFEASAECSSRRIVSWFCQPSAHRKRQQPCRAKIPTTLMKKTVSFQFQHKSRKNPQQYVYQFLLAAPGYQLSNSLCCVRMAVLAAKFSSSASARSPSKFFCRCRNLASEISWAEPKVLNDGLYEKVGNDGCDDDEIKNDWLAMRMIHY